MKKAKRGAFVRDGVPVELVLDRGDEYEDVLDKASEVLELPEVPAEHHLTLLTSGGAVIPKKVDWTLGDYLRQMHKAPAQVRLGIGVLKKVGLL